MPVPRWARARGGRRNANWHRLERLIGSLTVPLHIATPSPPPSHHTGRMQLPTLYKARNVPTKQPVCVICIERTRGRTQHVRYGYGVEVWLCEGHASPE